MATISVGKTFGCLASEPDSDRPRFDVGADLADRLGQRRVLGLVFEDRQRAQQRQARVGHRRELAREDREILELHPAAEARDLDLFAEPDAGFLDRQRHVALLA